MIPDNETVAYRLVNGILYGWCNRCFARRHQQRTQPVSETELTPAGR
jgi:hypothetical protein